MIARKFILLKRETGRTVGFAYYRWMHVADYIRVTGIETSTNHNQLLLF